MILSKVIGTFYKHSQIKYRHYTIVVYYCIRPIKRTVRVEVGKIFCRRGVKRQSSVLPHTKMIADRRVFTIIAPSHSL